MKFDTDSEAIRCYHARWKFAATLVHVEACGFVNTTFEMKRTLQMLKRVSLLLLVAAIGCTQAGSPDSVPEVTVGSPPSTPTEVTLELPDETATVISFYCPGMT